MEIRGIDKKDNEIINILLKDGRMSYSEIGARIGLSRTAVKNRIAALEAKNIIEGYKVILNPQEAPEMMTFLVNAEIRPESFEEAKRVFAEAEETVTLIQTTGKCHLTAICLSKDIRTMRSFVNDLSKKVEGISYINTNAVMEVIKGTVIPE